MALSLGDLAGAATLTHEATVLLRHAPEATTVAEELGRTAAGLKAATSGAHPLGLTTAQLRVLSYLPTFFSVPRIAQELRLSPATVRSHVQAIYRRLGVAGRAAAVAEARRRSLL